MPFHWDEVADHTQASTHLWLTADDVDRIERERSGLFRLKLHLLDLIAAAAGGGRSSGNAADRADTLRTGWRDAVDRELGPDGIQFYLRLDRLYRGVDASDRYEESPISPSDPHSGGLSDLIDLAGEVEWELTEGGAEPLWPLLPREVQVALEDDSETEVLVGGLHRLLEQAGSVWQRRECWMGTFRRRLVSDWATQYGGEQELFGLPSFSEQARFVQGWLNQVRRGASLDGMYTPVDRPRWDAVQHRLWYRERCVRFNRTTKDGPDRVFAAFEGSGWEQSVRVSPSRDVVEPASWRRERARWISRRIASLGLEITPTACGFAWSESVITPAGENSQNLP